MRDLHASQIKAAVEAVKARKEVNEVYRRLWRIPGSAYGWTVYVR